MNWRPNLGDVVDNSACGVLSDFEGAIWKGEDQLAFLVSTLMPFFRAPSTRLGVRAAWSVAIF
jgi:hypothetical protein